MDKLPEHREWIGHRVKAAMPKGNDFFYAIGEVVDYHPPKRRSKKGNKLPSKQCVPAQYLVRFKGTINQPEFVSFWIFAKDFELFA